MKFTLPIFVFLFSAQAIAWGTLGQQVTTNLAERMLSPSAKQKIRLLTGDQSLSSFVSWADSARNTPEWNHTRAWHYIDVLDTSNFRHQRKPNPTDILDAIEHSQENLRSNISQEEKLTWLKFLVHFVGDLHQPLHVGDPKDRGGTATRVRRENGQVVTLHQLWDSTILNDSRLSVEQYAEALIRDRRPTQELGQPFDENLVVMEQLHLRAQVYSFRNNFIDSSYETMTSDVIKERLWISGIRLANLLNATFE